MSFPATSLPGGASILLTWGCNHTVGYTLFGMMFSDYPKLQAEAWISLIPPYSDFYLTLYFFF